MTTTKHNTPHTVEIATTFDVPAWLELAGQVEHLFGPMVHEPEFRNALDRAIDEKRAFCVRDGITDTSSHLLGGVIISTKRNAIGWFAVDQVVRGCGIGTALLSHSLKQLDGSADITVQTFARNVSGGIPAHRLYERFGFCERESAGLNQAGVETVIMLRPGDVI
jgi:GNAT superfamily N-acetyltransferase